MRVTEASVATTSPSGSNLWTRRRAARHKAARPGTERRDKGDREGSGVADYARMNTDRSVTRNRRVLKLSTLGISLVVLTFTSGPAAQNAGFRPGDLLPSWTPGTLDIHQIVTGRGNAAFTRFPDGTTMLIDAGDAGDTEYDRLRPGDADQRPNASRTPAQWIVRYIRHMVEGEDPRLDYAVITHFHPDHMGIITGGEPRSAFGDYRLRGMTEVAEDLPPARLVDRGWPDYAYLTPPADDMFTNYRRFVATNVAAHRLTMLGARAGSATQITQVRKPDQSIPFEVRIVAVNDRIWTGAGEDSRVRFPAFDAIPVRDDWPDENMCSIALRIRYGRFDYFTGGDMPGYPVPGAAACMTRKQTSPG